MFAQLDGGEDGDRDDTLWHLDTGATNHMSGCRTAFHDLDTQIRGVVKFGDSSEVPIEGAGTVVLQGKGGEHTHIAGVYFIPRLTTNIVSLGQLDEKGCAVTIDNGVLRIRDEKNRLLARVKRSANRLYTLRVTVARPLCLAARRVDGAWLWHERYGHLNFDALRKLGKEGMVDGLPQLEPVNQLCTDCVVTKLKCRPFSGAAKRRADGILDLVHEDLCGPISPATPGGKDTFLLLVDDHSRYMWLSLLARKSDALEAIQRFQVQVEVETRRHLRVLRTDCGGEFISVEFEQHCATHGIKRQFSAPYTPQQNGVVERRNQTVIAMARGLLKSRGVPAAFWGEAVTTAVFLLNRAPTKSVAGQTPFEAWHGRKPNVEFLRTFGCVAFVKESRPHQKKLADRSTPMVFIGYAAGSKAWRFYNPASRRVHVSRDAVFQEHTSWEWSTVSDDLLQGGTDFTIEYPDEIDYIDPANDASAPDPASTPAPTSTPAPAPSTPAIMGTPPTPTFVSPPPGALKDLDSNNDVIQVPRHRQHTREHIARRTCSTRPRRRAVSAGW